MRQIDKIILASVLIAAPLVTTYSAEPQRPVKAEGKQSMRTQPRAADWAVYMEAPAYYLALAKEHLQKGENEKAAAELKSANNFIHFQQNRLENASRQIEELAVDVSSGEEMDLARLDQVTRQVLNAIEQKHAMVPVIVGAAPIIDHDKKIGADKTKVKFEVRDSSENNVKSKGDLSLMEL
jgi:hypothetical protein